MRTSTLQHALDLADQGIPVFPVRADKRPACKHGHLDATIDPKRIREMFEESSAPLVGFPTGEASGVDVLDVDPRHDGDKWPGLETLPATRRHLTGSGGHHYYFQHSEGVRNSQSKIAQGIDVRGSGGYVVAWPIDLDVDPAPWPADVLEAATRRPPRSSRADSIAQVTRDPSTSEAQLALANAVTLIEAAVPGERYEVVKQATWQLSRLILGGFLDEAQARETIVAAAEASGGEDMDKVERLFDGALEKAEPATVPGAEFDALPPETEEEIRAARGGRLRMIDRIRRPGDIGSEPARPYIVKGLMRPGDVGAILGAPGAGKSMLAPMIGYRISLGLPVFGLRSRAGFVLYMAAEDLAGMAMRVKALEREHGPTDNFGLVDIGNLRAGGEEATDLLATVRELKPTVVVMDTVGAAFAGFSENSSDQDGMGAVVALSRQLADMGASVVLVHHTAKQSDGTARGHSSLQGTLDWSLVLGERTDDGIVRCKVGKNRAGTSDLDIAFSQRSVTLAHDEDGDPITAPMAVELPAQAGKRLPKLSPSAKAARQVLQGITVNGQAKEDEWRQTCDKSRAVSTSETADSRRRAFQRAYSELLNSGQIECNDGTITIHLQNEFEAPSDKDTETSDKKEPNKINGRTSRTSPGQRKFCPPSTPAHSGRTRTGALGLSGLSGEAGPTLEELGQVH